MLEAGTEPLALEGDVVVVTQGGGVAGAAKEPTKAAGGGAQPGISGPEKEDLWPPRG